VSEPKYDDVVETIKKLLSPTCNFVYLLGSFGTERFRADSDIDIAAHFKNPNELEKKSKLCIQLEDLLIRDVDLVALNNVDPIFAHQVLDQGRLLFVNDDGVLLNWKLREMSMYPDFKMSREVIEKNLLKRKKYV
jgi:predicted nucleotidyltransferase